MPYAVFPALCKLTRFTVSVLFRRFTEHAVFFFRCFGLLSVELAAAQEADHEFAEQDLTLAIF